LSRYESNRDRNRNRRESAGFFHSTEAPLFRSSTRRLEAEQDRFRFERNSPDLFNTLLNLYFQGDDFCGGGATSIHDGESMPGGDANMADSEAFGKAGVLDQPCG